MSNWLNFRAVKIDQDRVLSYGEWIETQLKLPSSPIMEKGFVNWKALEKNALEFGLTKDEARIIMQTLSEEVAVADPSGAQEFEIAEPVAEKEDLTPDQAKRKRLIERMQKQYQESLPKEAPAERPTEYQEHVKRIHKPEPVTEWLKREEVAKGKEEKAEKKRQEEQETPTSPEQIAILKEKWEGKEPKEEKPSGEPEPLPEEELAAIVEQQLTSGGSVIKLKAGTDPLAEQILKNEGFVYNPEAETWTKQLQRQEVS